MGEKSWASKTAFARPLVSILTMDVNVKSIIGWATQCVSTTVRNNATSVINNDYAHVKAIVDEQSLSWDVAAVAMLLAGVILCFGGYSLFYVTLAIIGFAAGYAIFFGVTCGCSGSLIAAACVGVVGAILLAYGVTKCEKAGVLTLGAAGGFSAYLFLNALVLNHLYSAIPSTHQSYTPALVGVALVILGGVLAGCMEKFIIMFSTALAGAYMIGFGVNRLVGALHYNLNPLTLMSGGGCHDAKCYGVWAGIIVLALVGYYCQYSRTSKEEYNNRFSRMVIEEEYVPAQYIQYDGNPLVGAGRRVSREEVHNAV